MNHSLHRIGALIREFADPSHMYLEQFHDRRLAFDARSALWSNT